MTIRTRLACAGALLLAACPGVVEGRPADPRLKVEFVRVSTPPVMSPGRRHHAGIVARNVGEVPWTPDTFRLAYHWADSTGESIVRDGLRTRLPRTIAPGESVALCAAIVAPRATGRFELQWDFVQEGVTWFSTANPDNQFRQHVIVDADAGAGAGSRPGALARLMAFVAITLGHMVVVAFVLHRRRGPHVRNSDEWVFFSVVLGFGLLMAVLHALASTIGLGLAAGLLAILGVDVLLVLVLGRHRGARPAEGADVEFTLPWLAVPGLTIVLALLFQWYAVTAVSLGIVGSDAAHYHVPHAINFARGASVFGFVATPHLYPMSGSVWAAWVLQPLPGALLIDLMTLPAAVILLGSCIWLCRLATGQPGIVWGPWIALTMLATPLARVSLLPSADLFYASAFIALLTQCFAVWRTGTLRAVDALGLGAASGLLVGTKTTGLLSMVLVIGVFGGLAAARRAVLGGRMLAWRARPAALGAALVMFVGAGGIWLIRNWVNFQSPLAPSGLMIGSWTVFPGEAYLAGGYYHSVLQDLRDIPDYDLVDRFGIHARQWLGRWFVPAGLLLILPLVDLAVQLRRRRVDELTTAKLVLIAATVVLAVVHVLALVPAPWTSLEWTRGLALRYVLPFLLLHMALVGFCLFPSTFLDWHSSPKLRWIIGLAAMSIVTAHYVARSAVRGVPEAEWFPRLEAGWAAYAAAIVVAFAVSADGRVVARRVALAAIVGVIAYSSFHITRDHRRLMMQAAWDGEASRQCGDVVSPPDNLHRCAYLRVLAFERHEAPEHGQRRIFVVSRFDEPLELQGPELESLVFDVRGRTELPALLASSGPGTGPRDYVIIDAREKNATGSKRMAYRQAAAGGLDLLGVCGRFEIYRARRRGASATITRPAGGW